MTFSASVIQILIASPNDVQKERDAFHDVVHEWNSINARNRGALLLPAAWELDMAAEVGNHPQDLINEQLLANTDIVVGVFWSRIGTPTRGYSGGAVEEIETHLGSQKPALIYFCDRTIPSSLTDDSQQFELEKFKNDMSSRGLCGHYATIDDFRRSLARGLHILMSRRDLRDLREVNHDLIKENPILNDFGRTILDELTRKPNSKLIVKKSDEYCIINIDGIDQFRTKDQKDIDEWISQILLLREKEFILSDTGRGDVYTAS